MRIEFFGDLVEGPVRDVYRSSSSDEIVVLVFGIEICNFRSLDGHYPVVEFHYESFLKLPDRPPESFEKRGYVRGCRVLATPLHRPAEVLYVYWLEQIIHAPCLEGLDGVTVICSGHYDLGIDFGLSENLEAVTVRELYVHEDDVEWSGEVLQKSHTLLYGGRHSDYVDVRKLIPDSAGKRRLGDFLVLDYQCIHNSGNMTVNSASVWVMVISLPERSLYC